MAATGRPVREGGDVHEVLHDWDGENALISYDARTGSHLFIAIHSRRLGPAAGGTRLKTYPAPADALRDATLLARAMTYKMAIAGLPMGGGKSVLAVPGELTSDDRRHLLARHAHNVETLGGSYRTGPDVGTTAADMDVLREFTSYAFGRSPERGGSGSSAPDTAVGVFHGIGAAVGHVTGSPDLAGTRVYVQGCGAVGEPLVGMLVESGATVVVSDVVPERVAALEAKYGVTSVAPDVVGVECDVYAPCALGQVVSAETVPQLRCRIVAGAANNVLVADEDGERLQEAGILYAPDFVINGGGAIHLAGYESLSWTREQVEAALRGIGSTLEEVFRAADAHGISTETAAERIAEGRLAAGPQPAA
ncbi:MAG TPA: Glu/Leu/Phe/Val dehydrogenase dimerization domain-containing protein [Mycobacteriales bacterium]|nr:Glu/Leu/Phe/Val dehydrogenase dimerization domain-containing protein [Mycobacteriales bacterium]